MHITKNKNNFKRNTIIISVALAVLLGGGVYAWFYPGISLNGKDEYPTPSENTINSDNPTDEQVASGNKAKNEFNKAHYDEGTDSSVGQVTGDMKTAEILITSINQSGVTLTIASSVDVLDEGECKLTLTREGSEVVTARVASHRISSYTACEDFNVEVANLEKGEWNIQINYIGNAYLGTFNGKVMIK